jgi:hypothetical protein
MTWVERGLAEIFGVPTLVSVETEVAQAVQIRLFRSLLNLLLCYIYVMFFNAIIQNDDN